MGHHNCLASRPNAWRKTAFVIMVTALAVLIASETNSESADSGVWISQGGLFQVSYTNKLQPIEINRIHNWVLHLETANGQPVTNADITVAGGMPAHSHGLPTNPRMTQSLGKGKYLIEGMRFHMNVYWEISITVNTGGDHDTLVIPLNL